jgi:hypothetical protein
MTQPATKTIPLRLPGIAVVLRKGAALSVDDTTLLENLGFSSMQFSGRTVWLKENGTKEDFLKVDVIRGVDPLGPSPARYLNTHSFKAFLVLRSYTSRIFQLFHKLTEKSGRLDLRKHKKESKLGPGWKEIENSELVDDEEIVTPSELIFTEASVYKMNAGYEEGIAEMVRFSGSLGGLSGVNSAVIYNQFDEMPCGFLRPGDLESIHSPGRIFKFNHQLALPDPHIPGDVIGRYFLAGLGDSYEDQAENLELIKTGTAGLRLTRLGDELSHMYRCLEIAIMSSTGCVPIFSRDTYEGCVLMGGSSDRDFVIHGNRFPLLSVTDLKNDMLNVSDHESSLQFIASLFPAGVKGDVRHVSSLVMLRMHCLELVATQDIRDEIVRKAALLDFGVDPWPINPNSIKMCMDLIADITILDESYPIGRLSLFSKDPILIALSCFGEKSCPSWDIPNGVQCSLAKPNPPSPPPNQPGRAMQRGEVSDATWVMVIRQTDLFSAVDEFRRMASTLKYRSSSSALAKRVGHRVFQRDRMAEFWGSMREALRVTNPLAAFEKDEGGTKRSLTESSSTEQGDSKSVKRRRMGF